MLTELVMVATAAGLVVASTALGRRPVGQGPAPVGMPVPVQGGGQVEHVGVQDDAATGEWLQVINSPVEGTDEWWAAELATLTARLDDVVDNAWRRLDVKIRRLPHGLEIVSTIAADMQVRREFRHRVAVGELPTAEYPVIQVQRAGWVL